MELRKMVIFQVTKQIIQGWILRSTTEEGNMKDFYFSDEQVEKAAKMAKVMDADMLIGTTIIEKTTEQGMEYSFIPKGATFEATDRLCDESYVYKLPNGKYQRVEFFS